MLTSHEIRLMNLSLIDKTMGRSALCEAIDKDHKYVSQLVGKSPTRNIGDRVARDIEKSLDLEKGFLDNIHHDLPIEAIEFARRWYNLPAKDRKVIESRLSVLEVVDNATNHKTIQPSSPNYKGWESGVETIQKSIKDKNKE